MTHNVAIILGLIIDVAEESTVFFREFCKVLENFAGTQIRNVVVSFIQYGYAVYRML